MCEGDLSRYLPLKMEVGSFFVPYSKSGGYHVHGLDAVHDPGWKSCREVGDQSGGVFLFIVLCSNNVQLERIDILLELFSRVDMGGREPAHGLSGGVGVDKGHLEIGLELGECSK